MKWAAFSLVSYFVGLSTENRIYLMATQMLPIHSVMHSCCVKIRLNFLTKVQKEIALKQGKFGCSC